jgi:ferredoxin
MTAADIAAAARGWELAEGYICGPDPLMDMAEETLGELFGAGTTVLTERFVSPDDPLQTQAAAEVTAPPAEALVESFRMTLDAEDHTVPICSGETLLQAALTAGIDAPRSCTEGHCGTCMAWLRNGDVTMTSTRALSKRNIQRGYVLACQSRPSSAAPIWLDFDL